MYSALRELAGRASNSVTSQRFSLRHFEGGYGDKTPLPILLENMIMMLKNGNGWIMHSCGEPFFVTTQEEERDEK